MPTRLDSRAGAARSTADAARVESGPLKDADPGKFPSETIEFPAAIDPDSPPISQMAVEDVEAFEDSEGAIRSGKLAGKSMWQAIWILAIPVLLQQLMAACVGLVDKILAGNLPQAIRVPALDAISIGSYVGWLIGIAMTGLGIGGQAVIARSMGAGDLTRSDRALGQAMLLSAAWGAIVGVAMWMCAGPLGTMCGLNDQAHRFCVQYVHITALSMPFTGVMMVGQMCLHGAGETTKPSIIAVLVNVVNIILAWALSGVEIRIGSVSIGNPHWFDLHVQGVAAGTALSYVFGAAMTAWILLRGVKDLRLHGRQMRPDGAMMGRIIKLGVPSFFEGMAMWGVNLIVLTFIGRIARQTAHGEGFQGAHIIAVQWESLSFLPGFAMGTAAGALAGQYLGAKNRPMAKRSVWACTFIGCLIMGSLGVLFMTAGHLLTSVISREAIHLEHTPRLLFITGMIQVPFAIAMVIGRALRGTGDSLWPFMITTLSTYLIRLPAAWLLGIHFGLGLEGIWMGLCGELVIRASLFLARFRHGGWMRLRV